MKKRPKYCECGDRIVIRQKGRGVVPAQKQHELCRHCDSQLLRMARQAVDNLSKPFWPTFGSQAVAV